MSTEEDTEVNKNEGEPGAKTEKSILEKLLFDEEEFLNQLDETVGRATRFFKLERSGRIVLTDIGKSKTVRDQIRLLLAGRYFAWKLNLVETDKMNYREIASELNRPPSGVSSELTGLERDGYIVHDDKENLYSMPFHRIDGTLRDLEQTSSTSPDEAKPAPMRRNGSHRVARQRSDPVVQGMLEKGIDISEYTPWVRNLKKALDKGLAGLLIAKEKYDINDLTCSQLEKFLTRSFPIKVTRAAINMAFLEVKNEYIAPISKGNEISYSLLPLGKEYLMKAAEEAKKGQTTINEELQGDVVDETGPSGQEQ